ncbi:MAG: hypothetical protein IIA72_17055 [Proteobacteria bacterium]|nr:hypothetical protein [Pseudomonadota bacterium]
MVASLKDANKLPLLAAMVANLAVFYAAVKTDAIIGGAWLDVARSLTEALPAGLGLVLIGIVNAQLSADAKARIVFFRWQNPLPGSHAFTHYSATDPRIDLGFLEEAHGPLPTDPRQQNALWYKLYKSVEKDASVMQVHREFLFARDYTCLALMMAILLGGAGLVQIPSSGTALSYLGVLVVQFLLAGRAARNHGRRFVTTVLALKGAGR